jgi:hypothetical protein
MVQHGRDIDGGGPRTTPRPPNFNTASFNLPAVRRVQKPISGRVQNLPQDSCACSQYVLCCSQDLKDRIVMGQRYRSKVVEDTRHSDDLAENERRHKYG